MLKLFKTKSETDELYIVAYVDEKGKVTGFPMGGGSSTRPSIKAHEKYSSAQRSSKHFPGSVVVKAKEFEIVQLD